MKFTIIEQNNYKLAEVREDALVIQSVQDALDVMADISYQGINLMILHEKNLSPDFFELRTGLAGDILQKYSNYQMRLAIVGDFSKYPSTSLQAFIGESNRGKQIYFVPDRATAVRSLIQA